MKKIRYAIEKVIEVPETEGEESINNIIRRRCEEENRLDYIYEKEDDMKKNRCKSLFDKI